MNYQERVKQIIERDSPERKEQEKQLRGAIEKDYYREKSWYDGDNDARSPLEADLEDLTEGEIDV